jgi:hypothetical protein
MNARFASAVAFALGLSASSVAGAGAFLFTNSNVNAVAHPTGYTGTGGVANVTICLDPAQPPNGGTAQALQAMTNVAAVWSANVGSNNNIVPSGNVPAGQVDWESVLLHELGHCLGLAHPNLGSESCAIVGQTCTGTEPILNATKSTAGVNATFEAAAGVDGRFGSPDDVRGDDENLHYFQIGVNNPFTAPATVDTTTFTRSLLSLPVGQLYAANADRTVAAQNFGFANTEAVMQQLIFGNEVRRTLSVDDAVIRRYARSGVDGLQGTADDYSLNVTSQGTNTAGCNITIVFNTSTGFGVCNVSGAGIGGNDFRITTGTITFSPNPAWFYNQVPVGPPSTIFANGFE